VKKKGEATYQRKLQHTVAATKVTTETVAVQDIGGGPQLIVDTLMVTVTGVDKKCK